MRDPAIAPTSTSMCPASARSARELAKIAAPISNAMNAVSNTRANPSARRSVSTDVTSVPCECPCPSAIARHVAGVGQDFLYQAADVGVIDHVEDPCALATASDQAGQPELRQMLRDRSGLGAHQLGQFVHRVLSLEQGADDTQARLVAQELQHLHGRTDVLCDRSRSPKYLRRHAGILHRAAGGVSGRSESGLSRCWPDRWS